LETLLEPVTYMTGPVGDTVKRGGDQAEFFFYWNQPVGIGIDENQQEGDGSEDDRPRSNRRVFGKQQFNG
jgi:hypothetical protein